MGSWELTGFVGARDVQRRVVGRRAVGGTFVALELRDICAADRAAYHGIYYLAYATRDDLYVLHLIDKEGSTADAVIGFGERKGATTTFVFASPRGSWTFRMSWQEHDDTWTFIRSDLVAEGPRLVAKTVMRRSSV